MERNTMAYASMNASEDRHSENITVVSFDEALATDYRDEVNDVLFDPEDSW